MLNPTLPLAASDAMPEDRFGQSVSIYGERALIGGGETPLLNLLEGSPLVGEHEPVAYIFKLDIASSSSSADDTDGEVRCFPNDGSITDAFGQSVSISKKYALVGAPLFDETSPTTTIDSGAAYIFNFRCKEKAILTPLVPVDNAHFGLSVSISGGIALIGAPSDGGSGSPGCAYIFEGNGANWVQQQKLTASNSGDFFGFSVSISDEVALIGAPGDSGAIGAAYIYELDGGNWGLPQILTASIIPAGDIPVFGASVSISGDYAFIGAPFHRGSGDELQAGAVYVFKRNCAGQWVEHQILFSDHVTGPNSVDDHFGMSVSVHDGYAVVGAEHDPGSPHGFAATYRLIDGDWIATDELSLSGDGSSDDRFGVSVSIHDGVALVGAPQFDGTASPNDGAAFLFSNLTPRDSDSSSSSSDSSDPGCLTGGTISNNAELGAAKSEVNGDSTAPGMTNHVSTSSACKSVQYSLFIFISLLYAYIFNL